MTSMQQMLGLLGLLGCRGVYAGYAGVKINILWTAHFQLDIKKQNRKTASGLWILDLVRGMRPKLPPI